MDERKYVMIVHDPVFQILKEWHDEFLLTGIFKDELKEMTGEVEGIPTPIV